MAGTTGLEPATSAVTGQRSNQLSYVPRGKPGLQKWLIVISGSAPARAGAARFCCNNMNECIRNRSGVAWRIGATGRGAAG